MAYYDDFLQRNTPNISYAQYYKETLQAKSNETFEMASTYFVIKYKNNSTGIFEDIGVRLTLPYDLEEKGTIRDDYRKITFKDSSKQISLGDIFEFNGFRWIATDIGQLETPTSSCQVQRCNNVLKFIDEDGNSIELDCIAQSKLYDLKLDKIILLEDNTLRVLTAYNDDSKKIKYSPTPQRFILNNMPFKLHSIDPITYVRNGLGYIEMHLKSDVFSPYDDLTNGIADALLSSTPTIQNNNIQNNYTVDFENPIYTIKLSQTINYHVIFKNNGVVYTDNATFSLKSDDGISNTILATIVSQNSTTNICSIKCTTDTSKIGQYFRLYVQNGDNSVNNYIRIQVKSLV